MTAGEVELAHMRFTRALERRGVERRIDVGVDGARPVDRFQRKESHWGNRDSLVVDRGGRLDLLPELGIVVQDRLRQAGIACHQV